MKRGIRVCHAIALTSILFAACLANVGCQSAPLDPQLCACDIQRELNKVSLPEYIIEPPDILLVDAIRLVPQPPYRIEPLDALLITVPNILPGTEPITGTYVVEVDGAVNLGEYGSVVFISRNLPYESEIAPVLIVARLEEFAYREATAIAVVLLVVSFVLLALINLLERWSKRYAG